MVLRVSPRTCCVCCRSVPSDSPSGRSRSTTSLPSTPRCTRTPPRCTSSAGRTAVERTRQGIAGYVDHQRAAGYSFWAVVLEETGELIGEAGLYPMNGTGPDIELGYALGTPWWGRGYATEAAGAIMQAAFDSLGAQRVVAVAKAENTASLHVLEQARVPQRGRAHRVGGAAAVLRARPRVMRWTPCAPSPSSPQTALAARSPRARHATRRRSCACWGRRSRGPTPPAGSPTSSTRRTTAPGGRARLERPAPRVRDPHDLLARSTGRRRLGSPTRAAFHRAFGRRPLRDAGRAPRGHAGPRAAARRRRRGCSATGSPTPRPTPRAAAGGSRSAAAPTATPTTRAVRLRAARLGRSRRPAPRAAGQVWHTYAPVEAASADARRRRAHAPRALARLRDRARPLHPAARGRARRARPSRSRSPPARTRGLPVYTRGYVTDHAPRDRRRPRRRCASGSPR